MPEPRPEAARSSRTRAWVWLAVIVLIVLAGAYWALGRQGQSPAGRFGPGMSAAIPVRVAQVHTGRIDLVLNAIGTVTAFNTVTVMSRVSGELQKIYFTDGQKVKQGDLLAQIDPRTFQVQLDQALGQQKQNQAQLQNARRDLQRYQQLYKQNSIAKQQVDTQAALVQQYLGTEKSDQAAVDNARLQLDFTRITAPISGRLGLRQVDQGNLITASSAPGLVVITQTQPIAVVFTLPQTQLPAVLAQVRRGRKLPVTLYDRDDTTKLAAGELMSVDNQIDVATGTVKFKARFDNADDALFPNQFVNLRLLVSSDDKAMVIPTLAVQQGSIGTFVYVLKPDSTVHVQQVVTGTQDGANVAVKSGLSVGQQVVTEGLDRLGEGSKVEIMTGAQAAPTMADMHKKPNPSAGRRRHH
jgi:multidrug efflux system membrane fusion protein